MKRIAVVCTSLLLLVLLGACSPTFPRIQDTRTATPTWTPVIDVPPTIPATVAPPTDTATPAPTAACLIKGLAQSHLYHMPGQATYARSQVKPERGDQWFCTELEAEQAGFKAAQR